MISLLGSKKDVYIYMYSNKFLSVGKIFYTCLTQKNYLEKKLPLFYSKPNLTVGFVTSRPSLAIFIEKSTQS